MIDISNKIKELRLERNLKQKEVASALHIATNTLSQFENNKGRPSLEVLTLMADFFNVTVDYLIGREDEFGNVLNFNDGMLSSEEKTLLNLYSKITPSEREIILKQLKALSNHDK